MKKLSGGQYDADRERANSRTFGSAYDSSDSFKRAETNWTCDLTITHAKPKPPHKVSRFLWDDEDLEAGTPEGPDGRLKSLVELKAEKKFSKFEIIRSGHYKAERVRYGELMQAVNTGKGVGYVWNTDERDKSATKPAWVYFIEVGNVTEK